MSPQDDRAARIAALKAQRAAQQSADDPTPDDSATTASVHPAQPQMNPPRKQPTARAARLITIGASSTAALGLMTAIGIAEQPVGASIESATANPQGDQQSMPQAPGTLRVSADASVVMVVVDETGRPIDLRQMSSVSELQQFLATAQPIVDVPSPDSATPAANEITPITTSPTAITEAATPSQPAATTSTATSNEQNPAAEAGVAVEATPATTTAPVTETTVTVPATSAPAPAAPATTASAATAPAITAPPPPTVPATTAPTTTVPVAQPAPIVITLPSPTPPPAQGNTGGS